MCMAPRYFEANTLGYCSCPSFFFISFPARYERVIEHLWRKQLVVLVRLTEVLGREMDQNPPKHIVQCQIIFIYDIYELESQMREQDDTNKHVDRIESHVF